MSSTQDKFTTKFQEIIIKSHSDMLDLMNDCNISSGKHLPMLAMSLVGVVSTIADLAELEQEGAATYFYKEVEKGVRLGGISKIKDLQDAEGSAKYSLSEIEPDDFTNGMNYVGKELSVALARAIHELPEEMRKPEMFLRGIEVLLANLISQKFNNSHEIADSLNEHVHMILKNLENKVVPIK